MLVNILTYSNPLFGIHMFILYVYVSYFCFAQIITFLDSTYMHWYLIFFPFWLALVCMIASMFIHIPANDTISFLFMAEYYSFYIFM